MTKYLIILITLACCACGHSASTPAARPESLPQKLLDVEPTIQGIWEAVKRLEQQHPSAPPKLEEILAGLPKDYRANFTLMRDSKSLQEASDQAPRVIMFGKDAHLIITFNGEPQQVRYDHLEMIEHHESTDTMEMRSIEFGEEPTLSAANPRLCTNCHGSGHYFWPSYDRWKGAYGASDDLLSANNDPEELRTFLAFKDKAAENPRYSTLVFDEANPVSPYYSRYSERTYVRMPGTRLAKLLIRRQARIIFQRLKSYSEQRRFELGYRLFGCSKFNYVHLPEYHDYWQIDPVANVSHTKGMIFYDGDTGLTELVSTLLWQEYFSKDPNLTQFYKPAAYAEIFKDSPLLKDDPTFLDVLDRLVPHILPSANSYFEVIHPEAWPWSKESIQQVCAVLKDKGHVSE